MNCEFCEKVLSSRSNLKYHQQNNKKCLSIQQKVSEKEIKISLVECEFCNHPFSASNLIKHLSKCKIKPIIETIKKKMKKEKDNEIEVLRKEKHNEIEVLRNEKDDEIKKLKKIIKKLKKKNIESSIDVHTLKAVNGIYSQDHKEIIKIANVPKTNNNTIIGHNFFNDSEKIKEIINTKLDRFDIAGGQKGIAQFAVNNILKNDDGIPNYVCTDPSRHIFKFQNEDGQFEKDVKATKLTNLLFDSGLKDKSHDIGKKLWTKEDGSQDSEKFRMYQPKIYEISSMNSDNSTFRNELACLTTMK